MNFYVKLRRRYTIALVLLMVIHFIVNGTPEGMASVAIATFSAWLTAHVLLRPRVIQEYPLSTFQILVFSFVTQALPMVATLLEGHPLVFRLFHPVQTFGYIAITQVFLLLGHFIYRKSGLFPGIRHEISSKVLTRVGVFTTPTVGQLWMLGLLGVVAMVLAGASDEEGSGGALKKLIVGFTALSYAPFLIPVHGLVFGRGLKLPRGQILGVATYFIVILILSMASNSRGGFAAVIATVVFCAVLAFLLGRVPPRLLKARVLIPAILGLVVLSIPLSTLAVAMQVARKYRTTSSAGEMIATTIAVALDPARIKQYQMFTQSEVGRFGFWNEDYIANPFLARFVPVRFHDLIFHTIGQYGPEQVRRLQTYSTVKIFATLPGPLLKFLPIEINKDNVNLFSMGDYMYYLATQQGLGGRRTGSFIGHGIAMFGLPVYGLLLMLAVILCSTAVDSLALRLAPGEPIRLSAMALFYIVPLTQLYETEAFTFFGEFLIRGFLQMAVIYVIGFQIVQRLSPARTMPVARPAVRSVAPIP